MRVRLSVSPILWLAALWLMALPALAAPEFPKLTGRVVDNADMLDANHQQQLSAMLDNHEKATGEQIVAVTLPDLGGETIEQYGYQLGRHWGIGQADKDNGALLIVARAERKIRIEVGYGLEGRLTDAQSAQIVNTIIRPAFRKGDFADGITRGAAAMIQVLGGKPLAERQTKHDDRREGRPSLLRTLMFFGLMALIIGLFGGGGGSGGRRGRRRGGLLGIPLLIGGGFGSGGFGGGSGSGGFGGGFSGGGGGFGGGGASGGW